MKGSTWIYKDVMDVIGMNWKDKLDTMDMNEALTSLQDLSKKRYPTHLSFTYPDISRLSTDIQNI